MLILISLGEQLMISVGKGPLLGNTNVTEKVDVFYSAILNILSNFIPHEFAVCHDKDPS